MTSFVALLRGVNVGGARSLPMPALREALEDAGLSDVRTYLQSGNVVFRAESGDARRLAAKVRQCIAEEFAVEADTLVLPCAQMVRVAADNPFLAEQPAPDVRWLHAAFLFEPIAAETFAALRLPAGAEERAAFGDGAVYLLLPHGMGRSKLGAGVGRALGVPVTARNWRTVTSLAAMCEEMAG